MPTRQRIDTVIAILEECQNDKQKFIDIYLSLDTRVRKVIQNAFYRGLTQGKIARNHPVIVHQRGGINVIEINAYDIYDSLYIIKHLIDHKGE